MASAASRERRLTESRPPLPSPLRIGLSRVVPELKMFYRRPEQMVLTFSLPAVICILLGSIFSTKLPHTETSTGAVIAASMLAYGILSTSFINLGISIAADRDTGALRRLRGTPTTALSYFIGKICLVAIVSLAEAVILLTVGLLFFDLHLPATVFGWLTLTWVFLLGIVSCSLLGIFISNLASKRGCWSSAPSFRSSGWRRASGQCCCRRKWPPSNRPAIGSTGTYFWC
jgi:ABC-2 type transport system permease protein